VGTEEFWFGYEKFMQAGRRGWQQECPGDEESCLALPNSGAFVRWC